MLDVSVIILTYNEELHIRRCIENVLPFAREIFYDGRWMYVFLISDDENHFTCFTSSMEFFLSVVDEYPVDVFFVVVCGL